MSNTITTQFVVAWDTALRLEAQQQDSRLMKAVHDRGTIEGASFTVNNLGALGVLAENNVRHGDTIWSEIDHSARNAVMRDFFEALPLDRNDIPKLKANPVSGGQYMQTLLAARNRRCDKIIYDAGLGTILSQDGLTSYSLPAGQIIVGGGLGFTKAKLIQARSIFRANEVDGHTGEELFITYDDLMVQQIMADTTLTSADFLAGKFLQEGDIVGKWMGFTWIPYQALNRNGGVRSAMAWAKSGIHFGKGYEEGKVSPRPDKKDATQVSMGASYGAGRQDEKKVVRIDFQ